MIILGYILILLMGFTLGLIGAGGSILTIPILVYIFEIPISLATKYSLFIVGLTAVVGVIRYRHFISFKQSLLFYVPSLLSVSVTRYYVLPFLPKTIWKFTLDGIITTLFVVMMMSASYFLLKKEPSKKRIIKHSLFFTYINMMAAGLAVGFIMGLLGVGGGFLIIPTLIFLGLGMRHTIPTSLFIIMVNAMVGFLVDRRETTLTEYKMLFSLIIISWIGTYFGTLLNNKMAEKQLKKAFGILLLIVAMSIGFIEIYV